MSKGARDTFLVYWKGVTRSDMIHVRSHQNGWNLGDLSVLMENTLAINSHEFMMYS
jgi:hypothetical protein